MSAPLLNAVREAIEKPTLTAAITTIQYSLGVKPTGDAPMLFVDGIKSYSTKWRKMKKTKRVKLMTKYIAHELSQIYLDHYYEEK